MRRIAAVLLLATACIAGEAQQPTNPVVSSAREIFDRQSAHMLAAAEQMPAEKYAYHPTAEQWSYGRIVAHVAQSNTGVCGMLSGSPLPRPKLAETDPKAQLVAALKTSFEVCAKALDGLQDAQLGDTITFFGDAKKPRARALIELTGDLEDHYSQMAGYLRLNGLIPPSAAPKK